MLTPIVFGVFSNPALASMSQCEGGFVPEAHKIVAGLGPEKALKSPIDINARLRIELTGMNPSPYLKRLPNTWMGQYDAQALKVTKAYTYWAPSSSFYDFDGLKVSEMPNSTNTSLETPEGLVEFELTRGILPYVNKQDNRTGQIAPENYQSALILSRIVDHKPEFLKVFMKNYEGVKIEDPRMAWDAGRLYLYVTVIKAGTGMNQRVELLVGKDGVPDYKRNEKGEPDFKEISPRAIQYADGTTGFIDAKNATVTTNYLGQEVAITRFRPIFKKSKAGYDQRMMDLFDNKPWDYAIQSFAFKYGTLEHYDWNKSPEDLAGKGDKSEDRVHPVKTSMIVQDQDQVEHLSSTQDGVEVIAGEKGIGPGTPMLHVRRVGNLLLGSRDADQDDAPLPHAFEAHEFIIGVIDPKENYVVKPGERVPQMFFHDIRKLRLKQKGGVHKLRHYDAAHAVFEPDLMSLRAYLPGVIEADQDLAKGLHSGITDLMHAAYLMGYAFIQPKGVRVSSLSVGEVHHLRDLHAAAEAGRIGWSEYQQYQDHLMASHNRAQIALTGGESDSHTPRYLYDAKGQTAMTLNHQYAMDQAGTPDLRNMKKH